MARDVKQAFADVLGGQDAVAQLQVRVALCCNSYFLLSLSM